MTQAEAVAGLRHEGNGTQADVLIQSLHLHPGQGIDFNAVGHVLLVIVLVIYAAAAVFGCCRPG